MTLGQMSCQTKEVQIVFENNSVENPTELNETQKYILKKKSINSDFDYTKLDNIDNYKKAESFEPVNGKYTYYQFIATFKGQAYVAPGDSGERIKTFHDILIIKTNENNEVVDAYQFTLEWAERPFQYDVYKSKTENLVLADNLDIKLLKLSRTEYWNDNDKLFKGSGIIKLK
jgi:hypothetical protein